MAVKRRKPPAARHPTPVPRATARRTLHHIPLDEHEKEERRFQRARQTARSAGTTFEPDATRAPTRRRRGGPLAAADGDVRLATTPVRDQRDGTHERMCVGFALAGAMETFLCRNADPSDVPILSVDHVFKLGKKKEIVAPAADAVKSGVLEEQCFEVTPACADAASRTWIGRVDAVLTDTPAALCALLRSGTPLVTEMRIFANFEGFTGTGVYQPAGDSAGAHAMVIIGFEQEDDATGVWIVKNSLGTGWGDGGFGRIRWRDQFCKPENVLFVVRSVSRVQ